MVDNSIPKVPAEFFSSGKYQYLSLSETHQTVISQM
jgi:hypothetical protein